MKDRLKTEFIIIHHSLSTDHDNFDWQSIWDYHTRDNGWEAIGYHWGIEYNKGKYEVCVGRPEMTVGAHCKELEMNQRSLGICLVGNFDINKVPKDQWKVAIDLVKKKMKEFNIPVYKVWGHGETQREAKASYIKSCPGKLFSMVDFRHDLEG